MMNRLERVYYADLKYPIGTHWAAATEEGLVQLSSSSTEGAFIEGLRRRMKAELVHDPDRFQDLKRMLDTWHEGRPTSFDLPFDLRGTEFQVDIWRAIHAIPWGSLSSYGRLAREIGRPKAARAVGNAVGSNPIGIVIPCHRVIHSDGGLGGFGHGFDPGSLNVKRRYLMIEGILPRVENHPEREVDLTKFFV